MSKAPAPVPASMRSTMASAAALRAAVEMVMAMLVSPLLVLSGCRGGRLGWGHGRHAQVRGVDFLPTPGRRGIPVAEARSRCLYLGWLALHRPPNGEVSTPCHRQPGGEDVLRGVHVGVGLVAAGAAPELRLALTVVRRAVPAG